MISISHWGMFETYPPNTLVWPKGLKLTVELEQFRKAMRSAGVGRVVIDKSDLLD